MWNCRQYCTHVLCNAFWSSIINVIETTQLYWCRTCQTIHGFHYFWYSIYRYIVQGCCRCSAQCRLRSHCIPISPIVVFIWLLVFLFISCIVLVWKAWGETSYFRKSLWIVLQMSSLVDFSPFLCETVAKGVLRKQIVHFIWIMTL